VDVRDNPTRRMSGLRNVAVFGRAVTNVLQNLRSVRTDFDEWYSPIQKEMEATPLMKFFYNLRTEILKKGEAGVSNRAHIKNFTFPTDTAKFGEPPTNARNFFIGDSVGGTGWEVEVSPGVLEKYYVELPAEIGEAGLYFRNAPGVDGSREPQHGDVIHLCGQYVAEIAEILRRAEERFASRS